MRRRPHVHRGFREGNDIFLCPRGERIRSFAHNDSRVRAHPGEYHAFLLASLMYYFLRVLLLMLSFLTSYCVPLTDLTSYFLHFLLLTVITSYFSYYLVLWLLTSCVFLLLTSCFFLRPTSF